VYATTEDWVKYKQDWPANITAREKAEAEEKKKQEEEQKKQQDYNGEKGSEPSDAENDEDNWRKNRGGEGSDKHHGAYGKGQGHDQADVDQQIGTDKPKSNYEKLREKYSPEEITLLQHLEHEYNYIHSLGQNDGKQKSPLADAMRKALLCIDTADQFTPDNWIPRGANLLRHTGHHPLNAEPELSALFGAGLITPNALHYVRNHGAVPHLLWDTHNIDVENGKLKLSMDELENRFEPVNIPVALACDGNRRGELNMIKRSKGFTWGSGAVSCAYWRGARLCDVLKCADVPTRSPDGKRLWVNFEGADELSDGKYATCLPLDYAMDPNNDVLLAYEMNDVRLPPDHGFPVRLLIPGYVGGRSVKWLARIWISDKENDSHYHIWDNRVLPSFITEKDGDFASTMFHHPSTACNEQNLNSIIVRPAQGEILDISGVLKQDTCRVEGIAYDGGGHEVQRVELSLDAGKTWLYCIRTVRVLPYRRAPLLC
jgi:nitrate reductase (NAD(P)H)